MKTVLARITVEQDKELRELAKMIPGCKSVSDVVQRAVDNLIEIEGPVHRVRYEATQKKLQKRQSVRPQGKSDAA